MVANVNYRMACGLLLAAVVCNAITVSWLVNLRYLPLDHSWARLATSVSGGDYVLLFGGLVVLGAGVALLAAELRGRRRALLLATLFLAPALVVLSVPLSWRLKPGESLRQRGLRRIRENAGPIIGALESYYESTGAYPEMLEALVPDFLKEIPGTGCAGYPTFSYRAPGSISPNGRSGILGYELFVRTPQTSFNWDEFYFRPEAHYPETGPAGAIERVEDWAYWHE